MILFKRKRGSQRLAKPLPVTITYSEDAELLLLTNDNTYYWLAPESDAEWKELLSAVHRGYSRFEGNKP